MGKLRLRVGRSLLDHSVGQEARTEKLRAAHFHKAQDASIPNGQLNPECSGRMGDDVQRAVEP